MRVFEIPQTEEMLTMRSFSNHDAERKLDLLARLKHKNILTAHEVFSDANEYHVISEDTEVSLEEFIVARPNELQLAAITSQVITNLLLLRK